MYVQGYVATVERLDSPECDYRMAATPPLPGIVLLEVRGPDEAVAYRYTAAGHGVGETWYPGPGEARAALRAEFPRGLGAWMPVPSSETDPHDYAVRLASGEHGSGCREPQ